MVSRYATCGGRDLDLDVVLPPHALDVDVELELAHAVDDRLAGVRVRARRGTWGLPW